MDMVGKMEAENRIFPLADFILPSDDVPICSVVVETTDAAIVVWHVWSKQAIPAHVHPHGQDTWTVISGAADYYQGDGVTSRINTNDIVVARSNQIHGALKCLQG